MGGQVSNYNPYAPPAADPEVKPISRAEWRSSGTELECKEAKHALIWALIGLNCLPILGVVAIVKAQQAKRIIRENPDMTGESMATGALVLGILELVGTAIVVLLVVFAMAS